MLGVLPGIVGVLQAIETVKVLLDAGEPLVGRLLQYEALVADPEFSAWLEKRTPAGRWCQIEELVGACVFLSSNASSFVNGHTLFVDGGITASL